MQDFASLRQKMVDNQIRPSEVTDSRVIRAFLTVPRERFVADADKPFAYSDKEIVLSAGGDSRRVMMAPVLLARMVQALRITPDAVVLVVGCGTGYSAAILAHLAGSVVAVEEDPVLADAAEAGLRKLGIDNVAVVQGKLTAGYPSEGPFDAILVDGSVDVLPESLAEQLNVGGLLTVIQRQDRISRAMLYERVSTEVTRWPLFEAWTAEILPGFERKPEFVF
jgi:protein-L-isoaspartate(D-aspartate) O-methyltransferase